MKIKSRISVYSNFFHLQIVNFFRTFLDQANVIQLTVQISHYGFMRFTVDSNKNSLIYSIQKWYFCNVTKHDFKSTFIM